MTAYSDTFNRVDSTTLGSPWSEVAGDASIVSNTLRFADSSSAASLVYDSALTTDDNYTQAKVTALGNSGQSVGIFCRSDATFQNAYYFRITTTAARIFKVVSGTLTGLGTDTSTTIAAGDTLKVEAIGSAIKGYINGVQVVSVTDTAVTTGKRGGIRISAGAPANPVRFDDFVTSDTVHQVTGTVAGTSAASGAVTATLQATATTAAVAAASGAVTSTLQAAGTVAATTDTSGAVTTRMPITGTVEATTGTSGAVGTQQQATGTIAVTSATSGDVIAQLQAAGTVAVTSGTRGAAYNPNDLPPTPTARTYAIAAESRTIDIEAETRTYAVQPA